MKGKNDFEGIQKMLVAVDRLAGQDLKQTVERRYSKTRREQVCTLL